MRPAVILIISGGRDYQLTKWDEERLDALTKGEHEVLAINGGANGADFGALYWARSRGHEVKLHPADWSQYGRSAGPRRNWQMARVAADAAAQDPNSKPPVVVLFPGGRGTESMAAIAKEFGFTIHDWRNDRGFKP